ncbi:MAG: hypothetical protein QNJ45_02680 [Ardenticatenaceae bacterium]|nr:hypothetical protein [Ardenticatenaceae bacterium]
MTVWIFFSVIFILLATLISLGFWSGEKKWIKDFIIERGGIVYQIDFIGSFPAKGIKEITTNRRIYSISFYDEKMREHQTRLIITRRKLGEIVMTWEEVYPPSDILPKGGSAFYDSGKLMLK